jgi:hypothetical protein
VLDAIHRAQDVRVRLNGSTILDTRIVRKYEPAFAASPVTTLLRETCGMPRIRATRRFDASVLPASARDDLAALSALEPMTALPPAPELTDFRVTGPMLAADALVRAMRTLGHGAIAAIVALPPPGKDGETLAALHAARFHAARAPQGEAVLLVACEGATGEPYLDSLDHLPGNVLRLHPARYGVDGAEAAALLTILIETFAPRIFHTFTTEAGCEAARRCAMRGAARPVLVASMSGFDGNGSGQPAGPIPQFLIPALDAFDRVLSENEAAVAELAARYRLSPEERGRFAVVRQPSLRVPAAERPVMRRRPPQASARILGVGHLSRPDLLFEMARLRPGIAFDSAGPAIGAEAPPSNIRLLGRSTGLHKLALHTYDAVLLTSDGDGLRHAAIEAGAAGLPVIAAHAGGPGALVTAATGWPAAGDRNAEDYVRQLDAVLAQPEEAFARAAAMLALVRERHSWAAFERDFAAALPDGTDAPA